MSDPFSSLVPQANSVTSNTSEIPIGETLDADGSLATLHSPSLILQSIIPLALSIAFFLGGRRLYKFSTSVSLALSFAFFSWAIIVNVEPPEGLGSSASNPEIRALCVWSIMIACSLVGAIIGYQTAWWGSSGFGLLALGANAGLSFCFSLFLLGDDLLIHSAAATWVIAIVVSICFMLAVVRTEYVASLVACSLQGGFLFLLGVDLLINLGHEGVGRGICFLVDHNPDHREALSHYLPPKSTRVIIVISWTMTLCSIIFQSTFYQSIPFVPPGEYEDSHPFRNQREKKSKKDPELGLPPTSTDDLGGSDKERQTTTAGTTPRGLEHALPSSSTSSLNRLLGSHYISYNNLYPSHIRGDLEATHPLSTATNSDLSSAANNIIRQKTSQSIFPSHQLVTSTAENALQSVRAPQTSQASSSISTPSRLIGVPPLSQLSSHTSFGTSSTLFPTSEVCSDRYHRTPDPAHDPSHPSNQTPSLSGASYTRRPLIRTRPSCATHVSRGLPTGIAHSQQLRRVDTVEEVTEASTSICDLEGLTSVRSSITTPVTTVRDPSVNDDYVQAMLRLASQTDSDGPTPITTAPDVSVPTTTAPDGSVTISTPPADILQSNPWSLVADGEPGNVEDVQQANASEIGSQVEVANTVEGEPAEMKRASWLGAWAHSSDSLVEGNDKRFELLMPQNAYDLNESKTQVGGLNPESALIDHSDTRQDADATGSKDQDPASLPERSSTTQRSGFVRKLKKSSSSSLRRGFRLLTGAERDKPKAEEDSSEYQPSSPASSGHPSLIMPVVRRPGHSSSPQRNNPLLPGNDQRHRRLALSTSSSELLCRNARRLGPVRKQATLSSRPRGTSILSLSDEELRLGGSMDEAEAETRYLQRFSQHPLPRLPISKSNEDHSGLSTAGGRPLADREHRGLRSYNSIESALRSHPGIMDRVSSLQVAKNRLTGNDDDIEQVTSQSNPITKMPEPVHTDYSDEPTARVVPTTPMAGRALGSTSFGNSDSSPLHHSSVQRFSSSVDPCDYQNHEDDEDDRVTVRTPRSERSTVYAQSGLTNSRSQIYRQGETSDDDDDAQSVVFYSRQAGRWDDHHALEANQESFSIGSWEEANDVSVSGPAQGSPSLQSIPLPSSPGAREAYDLAEQMGAVDFYHHQAAQSNEEIRPRLQRMVPSLASFGGRAENADKRNTMASSGEEGGWNSARGTSMEEGFLVPSFEDAGDRGSMAGHSSYAPDSGRHPQDADGNIGNGRIRQRVKSQVGFVSASSQSGYEEEECDDDLVTVEAGQSTARRRPQSTNSMILTAPGTSNMLREKTSTTEGSFVTAEDENRSRRQSKASRK